MSRPLEQAALQAYADALTARSPEVQVRPKTLKPRLHAEPDPDLEGLSSAEAHEFKIRAKARLHRLASELASLKGGLSNYALAEIWLGGRSHEPTVRGWKKLRDADRYPRTPELDRLEKIVNAAREERFGGVWR